MMKFPPRRILAAVDLSNASLISLRAARAVAERFGAKLDAIWCLQPVVTELTGLKNLSRDPEFRRLGVQRLRARLGAGATLHVATGDPAQNIRRAARRMGADLLVVGTHRRRGLSRWMMGSVSEALVHDSPCPVLVVPSVWRNPERILAPVHGASYARRGLLAAGVVARAFRARLTLLHVVVDPKACPHPDELLNACVAQLPKALAVSLKPEKKIGRGNPVREILVAQRDGDIVVLVAHRKSILGDWAMGTTAERILRQSRVPVLAIPSR